MSTKNNHSNSRSLRRLLSKKSRDSLLQDESQADFKQQQGNTKTSSRVIPGYAVPSLATLSPKAGGIAGGTLVTITGTSLANISSVTFGALLATGLKVINNSTITVITPAHSSAGLVDVVIITRGGRATLASGYTYKRGASYLMDESRSMERKRRQIEQEGHRHLARVHARQHNETEQQQPAPEGELQNSILQHPNLDSQRFDGVDPNLNPEPALNTEARREFDNERREQEMEKQLRLGNMPKFSSAPTPSPK